MKNVKTTEELIKVYVLPLLEEECKRLGIPKNFVKGIYSQPYRLTLESNLYIPLEEIFDEEGNVTGVNIRLPDSNNPRGILSTFFHEMFHARELIYGDKLFSELRAYLYAEKRILQLTLSGWDYLKSKK